MFRKLSLSLVFLLVACSEDPENIRLSDVDLSDMRVVHDLRQQLSPADQIALVNFAVLHSPRSSRYCGRPLLQSDGTRPITVGDAIALARRRDSQVSKTSPTPEQPKSTAELVRVQWNDLVSQRDLVTDRLNALRFTHGKGADRPAERKSLEAQQKALNAQLATLEPRLLHP